VDVAVGGGGDALDAAAGDAPVLERVGPVLGTEPDSVGSLVPFAAEGARRRGGCAAGWNGGSGGNNGDGYAAKAGSGSGNIFRGCRAWYNSDDGWDCYDNNTGGIVFDNCWSFHNGTNLWNVSNFSGNGNGFKLGGAGTLGRHTLKNCMAFENHSKGFDHNGSLGGHTLYNCTGFRNAKWNFSFYDTPTNGTNVFKNNLSYLGLGTSGTNIVASSIMVSNSWQGFTVADADFASLDVSLAFAPRNADFSLPTNNFLRLAQGSQFIDKGVDAGLPYSGAAPDLGAFEWTSAASATSILLSDPHWVANGFQVHVDGLSGRGPAVLETSADLGTWLAVLTNPPVTGSTDVVDTNAPNPNARFYRVKEQ